MFCLHNSWNSNLAQQYHKSKWIIELVTEIMPLRIFFSIFLTNLNLNYSHPRQLIGFFLFGDYLDLYELLMKLSHLPELVLVAPVNYHSTYSDLIHHLPIHQLHISKHSFKASAIIHMKFLYTALTFFS